MPSAWLTQIDAKASTRWPTIERAAAAAVKKRAELEQALDEAPADTTVLVYGSLARDEWTSGSDLDWALLVDGPADAAHAVAVRNIRERLGGLGNKPPGPTETFGGLAFSHELVHFIGGIDDSNANTTRRILLLLESRAIGTGKEVRERVLRALLDRYVGEDLRYHEVDKLGFPRFLLNDYIRYWRTMTVDSAQKRRDRIEKWALRNIKLRFSRKLIYVAGLWACLRCKLHPSNDLAAAAQKKNRQEVEELMTSTLLAFTERAPLEILADAFGTYGAVDAAGQAFDAYETFLAILDTKEERDALESLVVDDALADALFRRAKDAAAQFQDALSKLFFDTDAALTKATQRYGVF